MKGKARIVGLLVLVLLLVALPLATACGKSQPTSTPTTTQTPTTTPTQTTTPSPTQTALKQGTLKLGGTMPLSGAGAFWGDPISKIAFIFVDLINEDGGVVIGDTKYKIELFVEDDKLTPEATKAGMDKVLDTHKVQAMVGHWSTMANGMFGEETAARNMIYIGANAFYPNTLPLLPEYKTTFALMYNAVFGVYGPGEMKKAGVAPFTDVKTAAVLSRDDVGGRSTDEYIREHEAELEAAYAIKIVYNERYPMAANDFTPYLTAIKALPDVDMIWLPMATPGNMALIAKQSEEIGLKLPIVTPVSTLTNTKEFIDVAGETAADRVYFGGGDPWNFPGVSQKYLDYADRIRQVWKQKYGTDLTYGAGFFFMSNQIGFYLEAAQKAGSIKTEDVVRLLESPGIQIDTFYGKAGPPGGQQSFGLNHFFLLTNTVAKIEAGEQVPVHSQVWPIP